jgi:hypothetical protein
VAALGDVKRPDRPHVAIVNAALDKLWLPARVVRDVKRDLGDLLALSSRLDEKKIEQGLADLAAAAGDGFRAKVAQWLNRLDAKLQEAIASIANLPPDKKAEAATAVAVLQSLVGDASWLNAKGERFRREHVDVLEGIEPALAELNAWNGAPSSDLIERIIHCEVVGAGPSLLEEGISAKVVGLRVVPCAAILPQARGAGELTTVRALEEVTFEVLEAEPRRPGVRYHWTVGGREAEIIGGPRLTYVFGATRPYAVKTIAVELRGATTNQEIADAHDISVRVAPPQWTDARRARLTQSLWELSASVVFALIAAVVAIATYWSGKAFGEPVDYAALLAAGAGVDFSVGAVRKLIADMLKQAQAN